MTIQLSPGTRGAVVVFGVALTAAAAPGCAIEGGDTPILAGPSGFAFAVGAAADPARLPRDGRSQAVVALAVHDPARRPAANRRFHLVVTPAAASLSATAVTTDANGEARVVLTAPPPGTTGDEISIAITAVDADASPSVPRVLTVPLTGPSNRTVPSPEFTITPADPEVLEPVVFDASATNDEGTRCGDGCAYEWTIDGGPATRGVRVVHRFTAPRPHVVTLTVTDAASSAASVSRVVTVRGVPAPTAAIGVAPAEPTAGQQVTFTAIAAPAAGHTVVRYLWEFGDGTQGTTAGSTVRKTYAAPGRYTVTLVVTDDVGNEGGAAATVSVREAFTFPEPVFTISPAAPSAGATVVFDAGAVAAANGVPIVAFTWDFGDGRGPASTAESTVRHAYAAPGSYVIRLTVRDAQGRTAVRTRDLTIE